MVEFPHFFNAFHLKSLAITLESRTSFTWLQIESPISSNYDWKKTAWRPSQPGAFKGFWSPTGPFWLHRRWWALPNLGRASMGGFNSDPRGCEDLEGKNDHGKWREVWTRGQGHASPDISQYQSNLQTHCKHHTLQKGWNFPPSSSLIKKKETHARSTRPGLSDVVRSFPSSFFLQKAFPETFLFQSLMFQ